MTGSPAKCRYQWGKRERRTHEVLLGCPIQMDYLRQNVYIDATVDGYANRMRGATLSHDGIPFALASNQGEHLNYSGGALESKFYPRVTIIKNRFNLHAG